MTASPDDLGPAPMTADEYNPFDIDVHAAPSGLPDGFPFGHTESIPALPDPGPGLQHPPSDPATDPTAAATETAVTTELPVTDPDTADSADPAALAAARRAAVLTRHAARRRRYTYALVALAALLIWHVRPWSDLNPAGSITAASTSSAAGAHSTTEAAKPALSAIDADFAAADRYLKQHQTFTGITLPGAQVADQGSQLYASRTVNGTCYAYGIARGKQLGPQADPTRAACTGQIATVQKQLDAAAQTANNNGQVAAQQLLTTASKSALLWSTSHPENGQASFTGLPTTLDGTTLINHGTWVQLNATSGPVCLTEIVGNDGSTGDLTPCAATTTAK
jgi:lipoprotein-anchoring transpeptidase ErfK/SrfK